MRGPFAQAAIQALVLAADNGGPTKLARIGIMRALHAGSLGHPQHRGASPPRILGIFMVTSCFRGAPLEVGLCLDKETAMTAYTVGLKLQTRTKALTIEAEDALLAALKIKLENPEALITYVRKANRRGDRRHPHEALRNRRVA